MKYFYLFLTISIIGLVPRLYPLISGYPYLQESDGYYFLDLVNHPPQHIKVGKYFNSKMRWPSGSWEPFNLHPYVGMALPPKVVPLALYVVSVAILVGLGMNRNIDLFTLAIPCLFLAFCPLYIEKTQWGWFDNDAYQVIFPLAIFCVILSKNDQTK